MSAEQSRLLNGLGLLAIDLLLLLAFVDQLWLGELPCPLCILQRAGFIAAGCGLALNVVFGPRPGHYAVVLLGALAGGAISLRQVLLHIVPGTGAYGNPVLGLHLYTWALLIFVLIVAGTALMLLSDRQFGAEGSEMARLDGLSIIAFMLLFLLALGNMLSTVMICGAGLCPDNPSGYLIFNENLGLTLAR